MALFYQKCVKKPPRENTERAPLAMTSTAAASAAAVDLTVEMHELNVAPAHGPDAKPPLVYGTVVAASTVAMHELNAAPAQPVAEPPPLYATVVAASTVES